jgi:hypothetical protein
MSKKSENLSDLNKKEFKDYSILIGSEVPDINYFLTLIKHYFFSQFYNYTCIRKTNLYRSTHLVNLNPDTDPGQATGKFYHLRLRVECIYSMFLSDYKNLK